MRAGTGVFLLPTQQELYVSPLNGHVSGGARDGLSQACVRVLAAFLLPTTSRVSGF